MIPDGFNETVTLNGDTICFRRMLRHERRAMYSHIGQNLPFAKELVSHFVLSKVQWVNGRFSDFDDLLETNEDWRTIVDAVTGADDHLREFREAKAIEKAVFLKLSYPHLLNTDCSECQQFIYCPEKNKFHTDQDGNRYQRGPEDVLLCKTFEGCPKGKPCTVTWTDQLEMMMRFDATCRAVGSWPVDPIVSRNKSIIDIAIQRCKNLRKSAKK